MKRLFFLLLAGWPGATLLAQDSVITLPRPVRAVFKLVPLALLDVDATVQAALEIPIARNRSVQGEFGYGWQGLSPFDTDLKDFAQAEVWRGRVEMRFYTGRWRTNRAQNVAVQANAPLGNYWAVEGLYKQINVVQQQSIWAKRPDADSYVTVGTQQAPITRYVLGGHFKVGRQISSYEPERKRFTRLVLDMYVGAGLRWAINNVTPLPPMDLNPHPICNCAPEYPLGNLIKPRSFQETSSTISPSVVAGLTFGFAL